MGSYILVFGLACFVPAIVSMARKCYAPEKISTPAWLLCTNALFILGGPVWSWLVYREDLTGTAQGAATVVGVILTYSVFLSLTYMVMARLVAGVFGSQVRSSVATLKLAAESATAKEVLFWSATVIAVQAVSLSVYSLGLSGGNLAFDHKLNVPYPILVMYMLLGGASLGVTALMSKLVLSNASTPVRMACLGLLALEYVITVYSGRRELIWLTLAVTFGIIWSGRRRWMAALPLAVGAVYFVIVLFAPVFLRARIIYSGGSAPSVAEAYQIAMEEQSVEVASDSQEEASKNTSWRLRTYSFWEQYYESHSPGFTEGKILLQGVLMSLPRGLFGHSKFALGIVDENLLEVKIDICNNVSLESYIDVGFFGPAIYGVVFGIVFFLCDSLIAFAALRYQMMAVLSSGVLMRSIFGPEANPITYFSELRSVAIYVILAMLLAAAFGRKSIQQAGERGASKDHASQLPSRTQTGPRLVPPGLPAH